MLQTYIVVEIAYSPQLLSGGLVKEESLAAHTGSGHNRRVVEEITATAVALPAMAASATSGSLTPKAAD